MSFATALLYEKVIRRPVMGGARWVLFKKVDDRVRHCQSKIKI